MKYLVVECHLGYAVVLGEDGRFLKAANLHYEVGQTVSNITEICPPQTNEQPVKTSHRRWVSALAAMAACLVLMVTSFIYGQMPYASVYMTINPTVRIDVNRSDRVLEVEGMNGDGKQLLTDYDPGRKDLDTVMDELVDRAIDMGYLHEGGRITLSLDGDETWISGHETHLNQHLNEHLTDRITVTIDIEQKQPEPTMPAGTIVIPVGPDHYGDSDYGDEPENDYDPTIGEDSAYGESDYGQSDYDGDDSQSDDDDPGSDYVSSGDGNSDDNQSDYADSNYDEPEDDSQTDYDDWSEEDGASDYDAPTDYNDAESDDFSDYDELEDDGQTDYDDWSEEDGASDYDAPTDYNDAESDDFSGYDESEDDGQTMYDNAEGSSDYEENSDYDEE